MKKLVCCALLLVPLSGCGWAYAREMEDAALLRAVALDAAAEGVRLTVCADGGAGGREDALVVSAVGETIPAAVLEVQRGGDACVSYSHVDQVLVGEEQCLRGIASLMDYLARDARLGPGAQMWAVRGSGEEAVRGEKQGAARRLEQLQVDARTGAGCLSRTAADVMGALARGGSVWLPAVEVEEEGGLVPAGYAVLRQGKLVGWTDREQSRGLELMEGQVSGQVVQLHTGNGESVSVVLERARTRVAPVARDGEIVGLEVGCVLRARVAQAGMRLAEDEVRRLRESLEYVAGERLVRAVELSQHWDADFLELERRSGLAAPNRKEWMEARWKQVFRGLELRVEVRAQVAGLSEG